MSRANFLFLSFYLCQQKWSIYTKSILFVLSGFPDIQNMAVNLSLSCPLDGDCDKKNVTPEDGFI